MYLICMYESIFKGKGEAPCRMHFVSNIKYYTSVINNGFSLSNQRLRRVIHCTFDLTL